MVGRARAERACAQRWTGDVAATTDGRRPCGWRPWRGIASLGGAPASPRRLRNRAQRHGRGQRAARLSPRSGCRGSDPSRTTTRVVRPHRVDGIPCTTLRRTMCDLGSVVPRKLVRRALTSARRCGVDLAALRDDAIRLHRPHQCGYRRVIEPAAPRSPGKARSRRVGSRSCSRYVSTTRRCRRW